MENPAAHQASKAINAWIVEHAGTKKLKILVMVNTKKNSCPIGYKNKDQVISLSPRDGVVERAPGPSFK